METFRTIWTVLAFLPAVVALFRKKVGLAVALAFVLIINQLLALSIVALSLCVIFWCVLLLVGVLAGQKKVVVVERPRAS